MTTDYSGTVAATGRGASGCRGDFWAPSNPLGKRQPKDSAVVRRKTTFAPDTVDPEEVFFSAETVAEEAGDLARYENRTPGRR